MAGKGKSTSELMEVLIYVLFASVIIPIIAVNIKSMTGDSGNYSAAEILILGFITTIVILGIGYTIYKKMF
jgi:hypothetical protein